MTDDERFSQDAIDRLTPVEPSAHVRRMVAQIPIENARAAQSWWPFSSVWLPSFSMAAVALFGLFLGRSWEESEPAGEAAPVVTMTAPKANEEPASATARSSLEMTKKETLDAEIEDLLLLATAGDFSADDWDLSRDRAAESIEEETF